VIVFVTPATAQDMPALIYDFTWTIDSSYVSKANARTAAHLSGSGLLTFTAQPDLNRINMTFGDARSGGNLDFHAIGTRPGLHADDTYTTGLEALNPPYVGGCGQYPGGRNCRVAEFTTPDSPTAPSSFTLNATYNFRCYYNAGHGCGDASSWGSLRTGTATRHVASAAEPTTLVVVAAGLLAARALGRRRRAV
jgi:hypothetical protein